MREEGILEWWNNGKAIAQGAESLKASSLETPHFLSLIVRAGLGERM